MHGDLAPRDLPHAAAPLVTVYVAPGDEEVALAPFRNNAVEGLKIDLAERRVRAGPVWRPLVR